jgi:hypothetical protein
VFDCIKRLVSHGKLSDHPKAMGALVKALNLWSAMNDEARLAGCGKNVEKVVEISALFNSLGCPSSDFETWAHSQFQNQTRLSTKHSELEHVLEHFKIIKGSKPEAEFISALKSGPSKILRVKTVVRAGALLKKRGCSDKFSEVAKEVFPLAIFNFK